MEDSKIKLNYIEKETNLCVGFSCNNKCLFCCEEHNKGVKDKTTKQIMKDILNAKKRGVSRMVLTGGEPTIRKDIFKWIHFAKKQGFKEIFIITNGRLCSNMEFCKKLERAGLTHILFSLNGSCSETHDTLTQVPQSFEQIIKGIKNIKKLNSISTVNNTVITKINYKDLPNIANLLVDLQIDYFEFIFVNPYGFSKDNFDKIVPTYSEIIPYLHKAIDIGIKSNTKVTAESIPFCFMQGYEKYMTELSMAPIREKLMPQTNIYNLNESRKKHVKIKGAICKNCKYYSVCEGIWTEYAKHRGFKELKPLSGRKIKSMESLARKFHQ